MKKLIFVALISAILSTGCATLTNSPNIYTNGETMRADATLIGVVVNVRPVQTRSTDDVGATYGALLGAVALSRFGVGAGQVLSTLAGAGAGAEIGGATARAASQETASEIVVRIPINNGNKLITVVQGADLAVKKGEWVYVIVSRYHSFLSGSHTRYRVVPAT